MYDSEKEKGGEALNMEIVMRNIPSAAHGQPCFPSLGQKDRGQTDLGPWERTGTVGDLQAFPAFSSKAGH